MTFTDPGTPVPAGLRTQEFDLRAIVADDAEADHEAVMETRRHLRLWEQSTWPTDEFTVAANRDDLLDLEHRHREHRAFTYTVVEPTGARCLGCVYVFPTSARFLAASTVRALADAEWADVDAVVFFWTRLSRMRSGMDERLLAALRGWFSGEWGLTSTVYVTSAPFVEQVGVLERSGLSRRFEFVEPGKPAMYIAYG